jgi:hypothetical protein
MHIFHNDPQGNRPPGYVHATALRQVVPIAQSCDTGERRLTITAIEVYEDGSILRYFMVGSGMMVDYAERTAELKQLSQAMDTRAMRRLMERDFAGSNIYLRLSDDIGTTYSVLPRGGNGTDNRWESSLGFTPAVPPEARRLHILLFEGDWQRDTGEAAKRDPEHLVHTFDIAL